MRHFLFVTIAGICVASSSMAEAPFISDKEGETAWSVKGDAAFTTDMLTDENFKPLPNKTQLRSVGEGVCRWAYTIYPDTPQEMHIFWRSDTRTLGCGMPLKEEDKPVSLRWPEQVEIARDDSTWKTSDGIHNGTTLDELLAIDKDLKFSGFDWEHGGRCCEGSTKIPPNLSLFLSYNPEAAQGPDASDYFKKNMLGEKTVEAKDIPPTVRQKLDIRVKRIIYVFPDPNTAPKEDVKQ